MRSRVYSTGRRLGESNSSPQHEHGSYSEDGAKLIFHSQDKRQQEQVETQNVQKGYKEKRCVGPEDGPAVDMLSLSLEIFMTCLDTAFISADLLTDPALCRILEQKPTEVPSSLNYSVVWYRQKLSLSYIKKNVKVTLFE